MNSRLKKFIWDNRKEFDRDSPSGKVWENIEATLKQPLKKKPVLISFYKWGMAAAAVLLVAASLYFILEKKPVTGTTVATVDSVIINLAPEYAPQVSQFVKMIDTKQQELKLMTKEQPELYKKFTTAISQLDSSYSLLKNQLSASPNREMLLQAMIQNLQLQLSVLNQQLNIIQQIKQSKKYSHEKIEQNI
ncbi:MAG: hypothetical protein R2765_04860 [Ferruginibacter sp.]|nr:hypothetical protein [Bacteroidota bacterium]MBX2920118.1 hypothetical protein [Ferruginibacter sp.]MCB0708270.1 hypothetical protein [Chitinophagaceae bacterium]MCC7377972.1 hypothetical protein [Chitinophagaceae bacterium]